VKLAIEAIQLIRGNTRKLWVAVQDIAMVDIEAEVLLVEVSEALDQESCGAQEHN
jgi:hypothetical protein